VRFLLLLINGAPGVGKSTLARRFADEHLDAVLVTDSLGAMTGILSYVDILRVLAR